MRPAGIVYDAQGNLLISDFSANVVDRVSPQGGLTVLAGTGIQGFGGDGGQATAARLDGPAALAVDSHGNVFVADVHNQRIRRINASTGVITTVAQAGGITALAISPAGDLVFASRSTHQVLRLTLASSTLAVLSGTGVEGDSGDSGLATLATWKNPAGLSFDQAGNLIVADFGAGRLRRIDAATGIVSSLKTQPGVRGMVFDRSGKLYAASQTGQRVVHLDTAATSVTDDAGTGTQGFSGDGGPAVSAALNEPGAVTFSPAGLLTIADTGNGRVRQVDAQGIIHTIAGLGQQAGSIFSISAPSVVLYGSGSLNATLGSSAATGPVTLLEAVQNGANVTLSQELLTNNTAAFSLAGLTAGAHRLLASYAGDATHAPAVSTIVSVQISPATLIVAPASVNLLYGQPIPQLSGQVSGVLARDSAFVSVSYGTSAQALSPPGSYLIGVTVTGAAASNYNLSVAPAAVTIAKAPVTLTLLSATSAHLASTTSGFPSGTVTLLDGAAPVASAVAGPTGDVAFPAVTLSSGSHTLSATYPGDADFLGGTSQSLVTVINPAAAPDFTLSSTGAAAVSVPAGIAAQFAFTVTSLNGALSSPILLAASGLPTGATASFNPAYLPPSLANSAFILTVQTPHAALIQPMRGVWLALLVPLCWMVRRRRRVLLMLLVLLPLGCGDRINTGASSGGSSRSYNITVTATATQPNGASIQHTADVTLIVQ